MSEKCIYADKCERYSIHSYTCNESPCEFCGLFKELKAQEGKE